MVTRNLFVFDNAALTIDVTSPSGTAGSSIVNNSDTPNGTIFEFQSGFSRVDVEIDDDGGDLDTLEDDQADDHIVTDGNGFIANGTEIEAESIIELRALDANGNETGPVIELTILSQNGDFTDIWGFATSGDLVPGTQYVKVDGSNAGSTGYNEITCFCKGTLIRTKDGPCPVEKLRVGDLIVTSQSGYQSVRAVLSTLVTRDKLRTNPKLFPVKIAAHSLGNALPHRDLSVSRQHRMQVTSKITARMFDLPDVLVPAIKLTELPNIEVDTDIETVEYFHLLFDSHEVIFAEGAPTESLFIGPMAMNAVGPDARKEILELFPHLAETPQTPKPAHFIPETKLQKKLVSRHLKNDKPLLEEFDLLDV
ncbi:MAG: Hint domain-containing protein [Litoreibacter sp.]